MTFGQLPFAAAESFGILSFLITVFCLLSVIHSFTVKAKLLLRVGVSAVFLWSFTVMQAIEGYCAQLRMGYRITRLTELLSGISAAAVTASVIVPALLCSILRYLIHRQSRTELNPQSLREGLDLLPDGIAFGTESGIPLLVNSKMQSICSAAFGHSVTDTTVFDDLSDNNTCTVERGDHGTFLHLPDGTVWDMRITEHSDNGRKLREYIAYNVTERYRKMTVLRERNERLAAVNAKIRAYSRKMDVMVREKEILAAKIRIHDEVGRSLLAFRAYLSGHGSREALTQMWRRTTALLKREAESGGEENPFTALTEAAESVGVRLDIIGRMPEDKTAESIIATAVHECLTNTVRHGGGDTLTVRMTSDGDIITVELANNGRLPEKPIAETGGLKALRDTVEMHGGTMAVSCDGGVFALTVKLQKEMVIFE